MVDIDRIVAHYLYIHQDKTVEKPIILTLTVVANIVLALMIERKIKLSSIDPDEYYCKPSILHIFIIMANIIFGIGVFIPNVIAPHVFSDTVLIDTIFITIWYYLIDVYAFTYIYFNVPKRNYAIRYIHKIFKL